MLMTLGHGAEIPQPAASREAAMAVLDPLAAMPGPGSQGFDFLFEDAPECPAPPDQHERLEDLADRMVNGAEPEAESGLPASLTYFGQFLVHTLSASQEGDGVGLPSIAATAPAAMPRAEAVELLRNKKRGRLDLTSVYGFDTGEENVAPLLAAMRDGAHMRLGRVDTSRIRGGDHTRPLAPMDDLADLPRIGTLIDQGVLDPRHLDPQFRPTGDAGDKKSQILRTRPLIGDDRNDETVILSQLHVAFLRLHNRFVDVLMEDSPGMDATRAFVRAQMETTHIFQWLVVNWWLPTMCGADLVDQVLDDRAPVYAEFHQRLVGAVKPGHLPLPMEFTFAAMRFGHSMARDFYDLNENFPSASLKVLFGFTWRGGDLYYRRGRLPAEMMVDWERLAFAHPGVEGSQAGRINTLIETTLSNLGFAFPGLGVFDKLSNQMRKLALRTLLRGHVYNLPSGFALHDRFERKGALLGPRLTLDELTGGDPDTAALFQEAGFDAHPPLWFYILKEAEIRADGLRLGPLGARIVAETVIGLLLHDDASYLNKPGYGPGARWTPEDALKPDGEAITTLPALLRAARVLSPRTARRD